MNVLFPVRLGHVPNQLRSYLQMIFKHLDNLLIDLILGSHVVHLQCEYPL